LRLTPHGVKPGPIPHYEWRRATIRHWLCAAKTTFAITVGDGGHGAAFIKAKIHPILLRRCRSRRPSGSGSTALLETSDQIAALLFDEHSLVRHARRVRVLSYG
jgi:hypothetical protein